VPLTERLLIADTDARPVALARIVIGVTAFARAYEAQRIFARLYAPTTIRLPYVPALPVVGENGANVLVAIWMAMAAAFALGLWTPAAGTVLAATLAYVVLLDEQTYSNHLYLLALVIVLLVLANAGAVYSLDAWRARGRAGGAAAQLWAVFLLRTQVTAAYLFAGLSKINRVYLSGATMASYVSADVLVAVPERVRLPFVVVLSWGSIALEMWLAVALWRPRSRAAAIVIGVLFHAGMVALLPAGVRVQLAIFAVEMFALYVVFFDRLPSLRSPLRAAV
jgi:hypothetical protein